MISFTKPEPAVPDHLGRISRLVIFDSKNHLLPYATYEHQVFKSVIDRYVTFVRYLHDEDSVKEVVIFFSCNKHGNYPIDWYDQRHKTWYIPVISGGKSPGIPTQWIQDVLVFGRNGILGFNRKFIKPEFAAFIAAKLRLTDYMELPGHIEGGNLQAGAYRKKSFLLTGKPTKDRVYDDYRRFLRQHIYGNCYDEKKMKHLNKIFYHLDNYNLFIGNVIDDEAKDSPALLLQLFLDPVKYFEEKSETHFVNKENDIVPLPYFKPKTIDVTFCVIKVPVLVFPKLTGQRLEEQNRKTKYPEVLPGTLTDADIAYVLSYTNGHVENYVKGSKRIVNIYLPDYSNAVVSYFESIAKWDKYKEILKEGFKYYNRYYNGDDRMPSYTYPDLNKVIEDCRDGKFENCIRRIFNLLHDAISEHITKTITVLNKRADVRVIFIPHDYYQLARKSGSLHCISKVLERDK